LFNRISNKEGDQMRKWLQLHRIVSVVIMVALMIFIGLVVAMFRWGLEWTGFPTKTLWDWLNLLGVLAIPVVAGLGVAWYSAKQTQASEAATAQQHKIELEKSEQQRKTELEIAADNQREAALQAYIDKMSELLLHEDLRKSTDDAEARRIATLQTLITLPRLDRRRKGSVLLFLYEAGLIEQSQPIIMLGAAGLHAADLRGCDLSEVPGASLYQGFISYALLEGADFTGMHLQELVVEGGSLYKARFIGADLRDATLFHVNMREADLTNADLTGATIVAADLTGAIITDEQLNQAKLIQDVTMPNGSKRP
jgi:uncharacterized protein YjbI with pentapeptide repeats